MATNQASEQVAFGNEVARLRTELEVAYQKLTETYRMASIGRLVAGIIHEVNTPVASLLSNTAVLRGSLDALRQMLSETAPRLADARGVVELLAGVAAANRIACERISSLVPGLKTLGRAEECKLQEADLNDILASMLALVRCQFRARVAIETDLGPIPKVECSPQSLCQVFLNVVVNAAEAIEGEGTVTVRTRAEGGLVQVIISDTGCGIRPEDMLKIFSPGFTTKPVGAGMGLGLSLSRQIVERHGGSIECESEPGVGTTFRIRLPVMKEANERA